MKKKGLIGNIIRVIMDPEREFKERVYLALTIVIEITAFIAFLGDIFVKENPYETGLIVLALVFIPAVTIVCFHKKKLTLAIKMTVLFVT